MSNKKSLKKPKKAVKRSGRRSVLSKIFKFDGLRGFTLIEVLVVVVVIGILATMATVGWNGVATSSANNARASDVKQWSSTFDLYKSRYGAWPVLPTADGTNGAVTVCLGDFTSTGSKCGNLSSQSYPVNTSVLNAVKKVGRQPQNTAPAVNGTIVGPIAYASQTTDSSGNATVTMQYIGFFQDSCPKDLVNVSTSQPAASILTAGGSTVACAVSNSFSYNTANPSPSPSVAPTPPVVATNATTAIGNTSATLNGTLSDVGNSDKATVSFECGTTTSYGTNTTTQTMSMTGNFTAYVTGTSGTTYHCRAKAVGDNGTTAYGSDQSFTLTTPPPAATPPAVATNAATSITTNSATLNGNLTSIGNSSSVTVSFECGTTTSYGTSVPAGSKTTTGTFSASVTGTSSTTYHCRAKAVGSNGTTAYGSDQSFTLLRVCNDTNSTSDSNGVCKCNGSMIIGPSGKCETPNCPQTKPMYDTTHTTVRCCPLGTVSMYINSSYPGGYKCNSGPAAGFANDIRVGASAFYTWDWTNTTSS